MLKNLICLGLAGGLGTLARYGIVELTKKLAGTSFPWGTAAANLLGCFLAGLIWEITAKQIPISNQTRFIILVGFMGAFTTFSAFILETGNLARDSHWMGAIANVLFLNTAGIILLFIGILFGRSF